MRLAIARPLRAVHRRWPFDVIHAHMLVPDGWAAARVGAELGVPVVATAHRAEAFEACRRLVDTVKHDLPVWKLQHFADGSTEWVGSC